MYFIFMYEIYNVFYFYVLFIMYFIFMYFIFMYAPILLHSPFSSMDFAFLCVGLINIFLFSSCEKRVYSLSLIFLFILYIKNLTYRICYEQREFSPFAYLTFHYNKYFIKCSLKTRDMSI